MRINAESERLLYNWITIQEAGVRLGNVGDAHVLELGRQGLVRVADMRLPGSKRGLYRVDPASVDEFIAARVLVPGTEAAA